MTADTVKAEQGLQLLDSICSQVKLSRADHDRVREAVRAVREALLLRIPEPAVRYVPREDADDEESADETLAVPAAPESDNPFQ